MFGEHLLCASHSVKCFTDIISLRLQRLVIVITNLFVSFGFQAAQFPFP